MQPQVYGWTCSACSLDWVLRATGLDPYSNREDVVYDIGYTENINPQYGLMDHTGSELRRVLADYGQESEHGYLDFDTVWERVATTTGMMSGAAWYHWVALRGQAGPNAIAVANSAPGYKGIYDTLSRADFARLGGFSVVLLV